MFLDPPILRLEWENSGQLGPYLAAALPLSQRLTAPPGSSADQLLVSHLGSVALQQSGYGWPRSLLPTPFSGFLPWNQRYGFKLVLWNLPMLKKIEREDSPPLSRGP